MTPEIENKLKEEAALIITAMAKLQSGLHTSDDFKDTKECRHTLKSKNNLISNYLEKECHRFANSNVMSVREADDYMRLVGEFDAIKVDSLLTTQQAKFQSAINTLDRLSFTKGFTHDLKNRLISYTNYLKKENPNNDRLEFLVGEFDAIELLLEINLEK